MNGKKRIIEFISAIIAIIAGASNFIIGIRALIITYLNAGYFIVYVIIILLGAAMIVVGLLLCYYKDGTLKNKKGFIITLLVLACVSAFLHLAFLGGIFDADIAVIVLTILSLNMKNFNNDDTENHKGSIDDI